MCTASARVSDSSNTSNSCSWDKRINWNFQNTQHHCMWNTTSFEQNTFYNSIKWYLPSGVNDCQAKLWRKSRLPLLRAGQQSRTSTRNSLEESQQDKRGHFKPGHHKISHCSDSIFKLLTNIKQGEQISNTINQDYIYGLHATVQVPGDTAPAGGMGQLRH